MPTDSDCWRMKRTGRENVGRCEIWLCLAGQNLVATYRLGSQAVKKVNLDPNCGDPDGQ